MGPLDSCRTQAPHHQYQLLPQPSPVTSKGWQQGRTPCSQHSGKPRQEVGRVTAWDIWDSVAKVLLKLLSQLPAT